MSELVHVWETGGRTIRMWWIGDAIVEIDRVYALAFTPDDRMLLVAVPDEQGCWLPGGGIEAGETEEDALRRELMEEANATIVALRRLGAQRAEADDGELSHQAFYWARITLPDCEFLPRFEVSERVLVRPHEFLDTLFWGRTDPKAAMLLERALEIEHEEA